jgi:methylated-DNA-[protein]-cysteine S-methyltransferase
VIEIALLQSPIGPLTLAARNERVCALHFGDELSALTDAHKRRDPLAVVTTAPDPAGAASALRAYFEGDIHALDHIAVEMDGTAFQKKVWAALRTVGAGRTASYSGIAHAIGLPSAVRAVGAANGANPVAVIVPCHRIIGTSGSLTGYGGGLHRKRWLLEHEGVLLRM